MAEGGFARGTFRCMATAARLAGRLAGKGEETPGRGDARPGRPEGCRIRKKAAPDAKRKAVAHAVAVHGESRRRACEVLSADRSSLRYRSVLPRDATERAAMMAVAAKRRRFGSPLAGRRLPAIAVRRRIHIMLERQ